MKKYIYNFFFLFLFSGFSFAQDTLRVEGNYTGKNIYVQNPFDKAGKGFCTKKVLVNNLEVPFDSASAYEINLALLNLAMGAKVKIEIIHSLDCSPKILNYEMNCHPICNYSIFSIHIKNDSILIWTSAEQGGKFYYTVEQFRWNKWVKCGDVECTNGFDTTSYSFNIKKYLHSDENKFRVKVIDYLKNVFSPPAVINRPIEEDNFTKQLADYYRSNSIEFKRPTMWELYDNKGKIINKGYGKIVEVKKLRRRTLYYLCYDNMVIEFYR